MAYSASTHVTQLVGGDSPDPTLVKQFDSPSQLVEKPQRDNFKPLDIIVKDIEWEATTADHRRLESRAPVPGRRLRRPVWIIERTDNTRVEIDEGLQYGLEMLNQRLPRQIAVCYDNMTNKALETGVANPAAYGDRLCR